MKYLAFIFFFSMSLNLSACIYEIAGKSSVRAEITDEDTGEPIPFASVAIYDADQFVAGAISDLGGQVQFDSVQFGFYTIKIQSLGYSEVVLDSVLFGIRAIHRFSAELSSLDFSECFTSCDLVVFDSPDVFETSMKPQDSVLAEDIKVGERELSPFDELVIYPNPVIDKMNISSTDAVNRIWIYDVSGNMVSAPEEFNNTVDLSGLCQGNYTLVVEGSIGIVTKSIIKL